jgi:hypothetical protein
MLRMRGHRAAFVAAIAATSLLQAHAQQAVRSAMARYLFVGILVLCFASPAFAAKRYYNRRASDQCKIVNIAPYYNKTTIRNGRRVYVTRSIDPVNMAIICKPEAAW